MKKIRVGVSVREYLPDTDSPAEYKNLLVRRLEEIIKELSSREGVEVLTFSQVEGDADFTRDILS